MYAVIRAGGKQYRVAPGDVIRLENQGNGTDGKIEFNDVLAVSGEPGQIARPESSALVTGEVVEQGRGAKILVFHYKRKKQYKKLRGHRPGIYRGPHHRDRLRRPEILRPRPPEERSKTKEGQAGRGRTRTQSRGEGGEESGKESGSQESSAQEVGAEKEKVAPALRLRSGQAPVVRRASCPPKCGLSRI